VRRHQLVRDPRQARDHHAQGHPAGPPHPRRALLGRDSLGYVDGGHSLSTDASPPPTTTLVFTQHHPSHRGKMSVVMCLVIFVLAYRSRWVNYSLGVHRSTVEFS
ncbi:unnamed protein product, partial [Ectocarpus sp. 12 AP-2014]